MSNKEWNPSTYVDLVDDYHRRSMAKLYRKYREAVVSKDLSLIGVAAAALAQFHDSACKLMLRQAEMSGAEPSAMVEACMEVQKDFRAHCAAVVMDTLSPGEPPPKNAN